MKAISIIMEFNIRNDLQKFKNHPKLESSRRRTKEEFSSDIIRHGQPGN